MKLLKISVQILGLTLAVLLLAIIIVPPSGLLRGPVENILATKLGRNVQIQSLHANVLSLSPNVTIKGLHIANAPGEPELPLAEADRLHIALNLKELLQGNIVVANLELDRGAANVHIKPDGSTNFSTGQSNKGGGALPTIQRLEIGEAAVSYKDDIRNLSFEGVLSSSDTQNGGKKAFNLTGKGTLNNNAINLQLTGGSVLNTVSNQPYPFTALLTHGATKMEATGNFAEAFNLSRFTANATIQGNNMADLYAITTVAFPLTKPYKLSGQLRREGGVFRFSNLVGKVGGSDLSGEMVVDTRPERLLFTANLHSNLLDPTDAGIIFGGGEEPASKRLLPNVPLEVARLRSMDADVTYKAASINVSTLPLKEVDLHLILKDGKLTLNPLLLTLPQGRVSGTLVVDAREDVPDVAIDTILSGAQLQDFLPSNTLAGPLLARVKLQGKGTSVHNAASHANGSATFVLPGGEIRKAFAELMGVNVVRGLGLLLSKNEESTALRCAIAHFEAKDGLLTARHVVFDTAPVKATGKGTIDLETEALNIDLRGYPKQPRILHLSAGVTIDGTLLEPKIGADLTKAAAQAGTAATLAFIALPAAILPFVSPGLETNANCQAILNIAEQRGVPIKK